MDTRLQQALEQSNYRATFENQKEKLRESLEADLLYPFQGGFFQLSPLLFFEVKMYLDDGMMEATLLDLHKNPVDIVNLDDFYREIRSTYAQAINKYKVELNKLKKSRLVHVITDLDVEADYEE